MVCSCLRYAQEEGYIAKNPCCKLRISVQQTNFQRVLTRSEQNLIQSEARDTFKLPVLLAAYTGMRLGEICALKWSDIDWEKSTVCVCRTVQRIRNTGGGTMLIIDTPNRKQLYITQTPQIFRKDVYVKGINFANDHELDFTDDCQLVEAVGVKVNMTVSDYRNIKITTPEDLAIAKVFLETECSE